MYGNTSKKNSNLRIPLQSLSLEVLQRKVGPLVLYLGVGSLWEPEVKPHK